MISSLSLSRAAPQANDRSLVYRQDSDWNEISESYSGPLRHLSAAIGRFDTLSGSEDNPWVRDTSCPRGRDWDSCRQFARVFPV